MEKGAWLPGRTLLQNKQRSSKVRDRNTPNRNPPSAFNLSFILIAVDDDRDNDDDGACSWCPVRPPIPVSPVSPGWDLCLNKRMALDFN